MQTDIHSFFAQHTTPFFWPGSIFDLVWCLGSFCPSLCRTDGRGSRRRAREGKRGIIGTIGTIRIAGVVCVGMNGQGTWDRSSVDTSGCEFCSTLGTNDLFGAHRSHPNGICSAQPSSW